MNRGEGNCGHGGRGGMGGGNEEEDVRYSPFPMEWHEQPRASIADGAARTRRGRRARR